MVQAFQLQPIFMILVLIKVSFLGYILSLSHNSKLDMDFVMKCLACNNVLAMKGEDGSKRKECVAVLLGLYKKNSEVSCVGFDFILYQALYTAK